MKMLDVEHKTPMEGKIFSYRNGIKSEIPSEYEILLLKGYTSPPEWWFCIKFSFSNFKIKTFIEEADGRDWNADFGHNIEYKNADIIEILKKHNFIGE